MNKVSNTGPRLRLLWFYLLATLLSYILASIFSTQSVFFRLDGMGVPVDTGDRLLGSLHDLVGMAGILLPVIAAGFAIALPIAGFLGRRSPARRTALYTLAGGLAILTIHYSMEAALGIKFIAGARTIAGLSMQVLAGAVGGFAFAKWTVSRA